MERKKRLARLIIRRTRIRIGTRIKLRIDIDWRSSRLSALSLMHRAALMAVALALATTASAQNAHATYAAKTQRSLSATARRYVPAGRVHSKTISETYSGRYSGSAVSMSAASRRTPDEVGRSAGLAIREQRALRQTGRSGAAARVTRTRYRRLYTTGRRYTMRPRLERAALRSETRSATRGYEIDEAAEDNPGQGVRPAETDESRR